VSDPRRTDETVARLAEVAGLELSAERRAALVLLVEDLLDGANEVSRLVAPHRDLVPASQFIHPDAWRDAS
jgi:hypothetical protein